MWCDVLSAGHKPNDEEAKELLLASLEKNCQRAAKAIQESDVLLCMTGAGFSADSGLAVYNDVARVPAYQERDLDYSDICTPDWLWEEPDLFYGFWGQCFNDYRATEPHRGYRVIARWREEKNSKGAVPQQIQRRIARKVELRRPFDEEIVQRHTPYLIQEDKFAGAFFSFTSNVDAHWHDVVPSHEIHECHGNIETWQCSDPYCPAGIWRAPLHHSFEVDCETMLAPETKDAVKRQQPPAAASAIHVDNNAAHIGQTKGIKLRSNPLANMPPGKDEEGWHWEGEEGESDDGAPPAKVSNWPKCGKCQSYARPAILMFGDFEWKRDHSQGERWNLWKEAVLDLCEKRKENKSNPLKVCILEIGCGLNVPTCRAASERMIAEVGKNGGEVQLVRVNPDFPQAADEEVGKCLIPIMAQGLDTIERIDKYYQTA